MAHATSTNSMRAEMAVQFYDSAIAPNAAKAVFGDQGHNLDGTPKDALPTQTALYNQLIEVPIPSGDITISADYAVSITGRLAAGVLTGSTISEFGIKIGGVFCGVRNSAPKVKDSDEEIINNITFMF